MFGSKDKKYRNNKNIVLNVVFPILLGGFIYLFFRDSNVIVVSKLNFIFNIEIFDKIRGFCTGLNIPRWIIYSLPDGIWVYSMTYLMLYLWVDGRSWVKYIWIFAACGLALAFEFAQMLGTYRGTYDLLDITFIILATVLANIIYKINKGMQVNEKTH